MIFCIPTGYPYIRDNINVRDWLLTNKIEIAHKNIDLLKILADWHNICNNWQYLREKNILRNLKLVFASASLSWVEFNFTE